MNNPIALSQSTLSTVVSPVLDEARRHLVQALYRRHASTLVAYAAKRLRDETAAEDVVQDAFVDVMNGDAPFPAVDPMRTLREIVRRRCELRRGVRGARLEAKLRRAEAAVWRSWRTAMESRGDPRHDEEAEQ